MHACMHTATHFSSREDMAGLGALSGAQQVTRILISCAGLPHLLATMHLSHKAGQQHAAAAVRSRAYTGSAPSRVPRVRCPGSGVAAQGSSSSSSSIDSSIESSRRGFLGALLGVALAGGAGGAGAITLPDGLEYTDVTKGSGAAPK